jgi:hypothetical protein
MSIGGRDKVTFICTKGMTEKHVVIVTCTTLYDGNQSCHAHNNCYQKLVTTTTRHGQYTDFKAPTTRQSVKETNQKKEQGLTRRLVKYDIFLVPNKRCMT